MKADQFLALLKVPEILAGKPVPHEKRIRAMNARIFGLGFGVDCSRCCGTGHYSYNQLSGTRCFKCGGAKYEMPELTRDLFERIERAVIAGELDKYLANVRARQAVEKAAKGATDAVMKAWQAHDLSAVYKWNLATSEPYHREIADKVNKPMCDAFDRVSKLATIADSLSYKLSGRARNSKPLTTEQRATLETERAQAMADLITARDEGLKTIAEAGALIPIIRAKYGV